MLKDTKDKMNKYAQSLPPSTQRAKCYAIANFNLKGGDVTIADRLCEGQAHTSDAKRHATLMVEAGCATETGGTELLYGTFTFEDGSTL